MKHLMLALTFLLPLANVAFAQPQDSIFIAGATLRLGMTRDEVSSLLPISYDLRPAEGATDTWVIVTKAGPPFESPGNLMFERGRLIGISKDWGNFRGPDALRLGEALFATISRVAQAGLPCAIVTVRSAREPQIALQTVELTSGNTSVTLSVLEDPKVGRLVAVSEQVSQQLPR